METSNLSPDTLDSIKKRLRRIEGQVRGLEKMIEEGRSCDEVLTQMTAVKKAVESASSLILEEFLTICATELSAGDAKKPEEIVSMLRRFG